MSAHALTTTLARSESYMQTTCRYASTCSNQQQTAHNTYVHMKHQTHEVVFYLHSKLHEWDKVLTDSYDEKPESIASTDFAEALANTDPDSYVYLPWFNQCFKVSAICLQIQQHSYMGLNTKALGSIMLNVYFNSVQTAHPCTWVPCT